LAWRSERTARNAGLIPQHRHELRRPEIAAADFFWPKLSSGVIVVLDDYGFTAHLEQKRAFDEFACQRPVIADRTRYAH
jgi:hypothetical protein